MISENADGTVLGVEGGALHATKQRRDVHLAGSSPMTSPHRSCLRIGDATSTGCPHW